jgi:hypothetical protein
VYKRQSNNRASEKKLRGSGLLKHNKSLMTNRQHSPIGSYSRNNRPPNKELSRQNKKHLIGDFEGRSLGLNQVKAE